MFLFPEPSSLSLSEGTYAFAPDQICRDLVSFYRKVLSGVPDIRVNRSPMMEKEAYCLSVDASGALIEAMRETLAANKQIMLFLNSRT